FILTAEHEDHRSGMLASWVQQTAFEPPMVSVSIGKGRPILPLIAESHKFGLCQIGKQNKTLMKKFASGVDPSEDPFLGFNMLPHAETTVPVLADALAYLECEVACHVDAGADHDVFIGEVKAGDYLEGEPDVRLRENGFNY
ncbi:MAG: flavin reductase family protein, partial [Phycisphaeraceae bacterium]|nr:flavin reductase family protein [Phycisphaeraceae bacterium]